jgi:hypothetical protein
VAGKSTRITVDLGSEELVKSLKIAAVEHRRTVRDIVVEALEAWLAYHGTGGERTDAGTSRSDGGLSSGDKDYRSMIDTLNRYRGLGGR